MTRINTIDPIDLTDQHLMAEYREIFMVNAALKRSLGSKRGVFGIPSEYTLNAGHVKYFYNKGLYLHHRYNCLVDQLISRGYQINPANRDVVPFTVFGDTLYNDWTPSKQDHGVLIERLFERIAAKPQWYKINSIAIDFDQYKAKLINKYLV